MPPTSSPEFLHLHHPQVKVKIKPTPMQSSSINGLWPTTFPVLPWNLSKWVFLWHSIAIWPLTLFSPSVSSLATSIFLKSCYASCGYVFMTVLPLPGISLCKFMEILPSLKLQSSNNKRSNIPGKELLNSPFVCIRWYEGSTWAI